VSPPEPDARLSATAPDPVGLRREIGAWDATMVVAGGILGVGIFVNPSNVARIVREPGWILLAWTLGGLFALAGAFVYAELGSRLPVVGGQYAYLARSWGPWAGSLYGFALLFTINSGGVAAVASVLASYVDRTFVPLGATGRTLLAAAVVLGLAELNVLGVRPGTRANTILMALKLAGIGGLLALGLFGDAPAASGGVEAASVTPSLFLAALVPVLFAYGGWQNCGSLAAEIRDPARSLVRANLAGVGIVVAVYLALVALYLAVLGPAEVAASDALAADVARRLAGEAGARFVAGLIVVSCLGFLAVMTLTGPRLYYAMALDGLFLRRAARLHPRHRTPSFTIRLQAWTALALLLTHTYDQLLSYVVFCDGLFFALTAAGLFLLRRRDGAGGAPAGVFTASGHPWTTALFAAAAAAITVNSFVAAPRQAAAGCGVLAVGALFHLAARRRAA
jgi:APA family basic amino acid/polyamine antiporter